MKITDTTEYLNEVHNRWMPVPPHWRGLDSSEVSHKLHFTVNSPEQCSYLLPDESRVLRFIRETGGADESQILSLLFPAPKFPDGIAPNSPESAAWYDRNVAWKAKAYGGTFHRWDGSPEPETPYCDTYSAQRFAITQRLTKLGLIREHNNGFNAYWWTAEGSK